MAQTNNPFLTRAQSNLAAGVCVLMALLSAPRARSQRTSANSVPVASFDVASIKLSKSRAPLGGQHLFGDRFNATGTAMGLIRVAYGHDGRNLTSSEISGGPSWTEAQVFDIDAKVDDSLVAGEWTKLSFEQQWDQVRSMLRTLLIERFKLTVIHKAKQMTVYALVLAKGSPKLAEDENNADGGGVFARGRGNFEAKSAPMPWLIQLLSFQPELAGRMVVDQTGLRGRYSFTLQWTPQDSAEDVGQSGAALSQGVPASSLFDALTEQLGLKLVTTKASVDTIFIESISQPSEN